MWKTDEPLFEMLVEACGSRFMAINFITTCARQKYKQIDYHILDSEMITWILKGEDPDKYYSKHKKKSIEQKMIDEFLCYIDDVEIQLSVRSSYEASIKCRHLIYKYHTGLNEGERTRVRILVRMLSYQIS